MQTVVPALLAIVFCLQPARADDQRTFCGKTVEGWREVLRDKAGTAAGRRQAVEALGCCGPLAMQAVPDLIEAIRHREFQGEAVEALVLIGSGAEVTVPILIERFLKRGCQHRTGMGTFFVDDSMEESLVRIGGPAVPALLEVLTGPDRDMRACAAAVLGKIGPAARAAVPALIRTIEHPDTDPQAVILRGFAIRALGRIGSEARAAVPVLNHHLDEALKRLSPEGDHIDIGVARLAEDQMRRDLLRRQGDLVALDVATALDGIDAPPVGKLLDTFLVTGDTSMACQLAWFGPRGREAAPRLRGALSDRRLKVRIFAAVALAHIEPSATESIPVLIEGLHHDDDGAISVRQFQQIPRVLARLGPRAGPAIPTLIGLVKKGCDDRYIHMALVQIDPEGKECVPALIGALDHEDYHVVDVAANCLGLLGPRAKDAVAPLAAVVTRDFDNEEFYNGVDPPASAAKALRRIGPAAKAAIPALIEALKYRRVVRPHDLQEYRDPSAAVAAAEVLSSFGADAKSAIPALVEAVQTPEKDDQDWLVRQAAILTLGHMGPDAKTAIPVFENLINDDLKPSEYRAEAIAALCQVAPDRKELAEKWLAKPPSGRVGWHKSLFHRHPLDEVEARALVLGALVRPSIEGDCLTRSVLEDLDGIFAQANPSAGEPPMHLGERFELLGRFGVGGRLAIPRLNEFRKHPSPWVRIWATEALRQIIPANRD